MKIYFVFLSLATTLIDCEAYESYSFVIQSEVRDEICGNNFTGHLPHPSFCPFFYFCDNGTSYLMECPSALYYNPDTKTCDYPQNVKDCEGGTHPPSTSSPVPTTISSTTSSTSTISSGPTTPTTEITSESTVASTPTTESTTYTTMRTTSSKPGDLQCPADQTVFMPYPGDCTRYYYCSGGVVINIRSCLEGLWFDFNLQACISPWVSICPNF